MKRSRDSPDTALTSDRVPDRGSPSGTDFEVFLSFRGPDTGGSFTDSLYHALRAASVRVFREKEEIRKDEKIRGELLHAIECSKVYMPIFSRNYAASAWCLLELTHMVEHASKATDKVILPIFYDVKPDDVKLKDDVNHKSLYLADLEKHKEKFSHHDVQQWKKALIEVGRIDGWDLQEIGHGEIIDSVVCTVLNELKKGMIILSKELVGIHDHMRDFMKLLLKGPRDIPYMVIHGMGGIGKTTLAKVVYNHILHQFDVSCFLGDIGDNVKRHGIMCLQKHLLSRLDPRKYLVSHGSVHAEIDLISTRFRDKKVLLVLDDVDTKDQLLKLAGKKDWFGPGSKIIITTRDINFFPIEEEDEGTSFQEHYREFVFYEMTEMDSSHALQLFCRRAFGKDSPPPNFADFAHKISSKSGGLPLVLEVLGYQLYHRHLIDWVMMLEKLDKHLDPSVFKALRISYDMLKSHQKEIFLDIACFFVGREKLPPYYMWKASNYFPKRKSLVLSHMSLIKIVENDTLWMNVQLRDCGREIIAHEDFRNPWKRSRLWDPEIALKVIRMQELKHNVRALRTVLSKEYNFTSEEFSRMPNLRFLELEGGNLVGDFKNILSELTWLSWSNCPSELNATNLCLQKLVVLELSGSNITEDWAGWGPCLVSKDLKVIQITQCPSLKRTPDISKCSKLKRLVLQGGETSLVVNGSLSKLVVHGF